MSDLDPSTILVTPIENIIQQVAQAVAKAQLALDKATLQSQKALQKPSDQDQELEELRAVGAACAVACGALIYLLVRASKASRSASIVGAGLFFAAYRFTGGYYDLARADTLFLAFALAALLALEVGRTAASDLVAAALLVLSFLAKQTALFIALPLAAWRLIDGRGVRRPGEPPPDDPRPAAERDHAVPHHPREGAVQQPGRLPRDHPGACVRRADDDATAVADRRG